MSSNIFGGWPLSISFDCISECIFSDPKFRYCGENLLHMTCVLRTSMSKVDLQNRNRWLTETSFCLILESRDIFSKFYCVLTYFFRIKFRELERSINIFSAIHVDPQEFILLIRNRICLLPLFKSQMQKTNMLLVTKHNCSKNGNGFNIHRIGAIGRLITAYSSST